MSATIQQLQAAIASERAHRDAKWGTVQENPHSLAGWLLIAERELDEAIEAWIRKSGDREAKAELLQFVSVGTAWLEQTSGNGGWLFEEGQSEGQLFPFEEWLLTSRSDLRRATDDIAIGMYEDAGDSFCAAIGAGATALLQHGIVERGDL